LITDNDKNIFSAIYAIREQKSIKMIILNAKVRYIFHLASRTNCRFVISDVALGLLNQNFVDQFLYRMASSSNSDIEH